MKTYKINMTFEHTYTMIINCENSAQAELIAKNASMQSNDKRIIEEYDGNFEDFIRIENVQEVITVD